MLTLKQGKLVILNHYYHLHTIIILLLGLFLNLVLNFLQTNYLFFQLIYLQDQMDQEVLDIYPLLLQNQMDQEVQSRCEMDVRLPFFTLCYILRKKHLYFQIMIFHLQETTKIVLPAALALAVHHLTKKTCMFLEGIMILGTDMFDDPENM